eukprot:scaffold776_cov347-Pavlova_lutheri.AAC.50
MSKSKAQDAHCKAYSCGAVQLVEETKTTTVRSTIGTKHKIVYTECRKERPLICTATCGAPQVQDGHVDAARTTLDKARRRRGR